MKENILIDKSIAFAARIIKLHQHLIKTKKETIISKQANPLPTRKLWTGRTDLEFLTRNMSTPTPLNHGSIL